MRKLALIFALGALVAFPQYAFAQANSGIDQYEENVPGAGGDRSSDGGGSGSGGSGDGSGPGLDAGSASFGSSLSAVEAGAGGKAGGQQPGGGDSNAGSRHGRGDDVSSVSGEEGSGVSNSVVADTSDGGGMGIVLPIILGASLLGALVFFLVRRRGGGKPAPSA